MKKLISLVMFLFMLSFVSSAEGLGDILRTLDSSLVILIALFLISFSISFFSLNKVFKDNQSIAGILSGVISFLVVYGINKMQIDTPALLLNIGISGEALSLALFVAITGGIIIMFVKLKTKALLILGTLLLGLSFIVYAKALLMTTGLILLIIWFVMEVLNKKDGKGKGQATGVTSTH
jgi:hypothetical protein